MKLILAKISKKIEWRKKRKRRKHKMEPLGQYLPATLIEYVIAPYVMNPRERWFRDNCPLDQFLGELMKWHDVEYVWNRCRYPKGQLKSILKEIPGDDVYDVSSADDRIKVYIRDRRIHRESFIYTLRDINRGRYDGAFDAKRLRSYYMFREVMFRVQQGRFNLISRKKRDEYMMINTRIKKERDEMIMAMEKQLEKYLMNRQ